MNEKTYNMYVKVITLACRNVKTELCKLNMFKGDELTVKIRGKDKLVNLVEQITKNPKNALTLYSGMADKFLVIWSDEPMVKSLTAGEIFVESVIRSRDARVAQKRLVEYGASEKFLGAAYVYDSKHPVTRNVESAMEKAKEIVAKTYSLAVISVFDFGSGRPSLDLSVRKNLEDTAFDPRFAFLKRDAIDTMIHNKYESEFAGKTHVFAPPKEASQQVISQIERAKQAMKKAPIQPKIVPITSKTIGLDDIWKGVFAQLPMTNKRRRFINLKLSNNDIFISNRSVLIQKRQIEKIEGMTKHKYIMDFYSDQKPTNADEDIVRYLFQQENRMYKYMWKSPQSVRYQGGRLYFPDGANMLVPKEYAPHEFFHKVNTTYAALFGFNKTDDTRGGKNWLYDSIRKAYTEEGRADYRLAMIEKRLGTR